MEHVSATAAIDKSLLGTFANARSFSAIMLLERDYRWCAKTMLGFQSFVGVDSGI